MSKSVPTRSTAAQQVTTFIGKFTPADQRRIRAVRSALRRRFRTANELVWDNYNFFVIAYSPTERPSDSIVSLAARANGLGVCFMQGATLPDPTKALRGSGTRTRFLRIEAALDLKRPDVEALVAAAIAQSRVPLPKAGGRKLIIRSVSTKQRPRRTPSALKR